MIHHAKQPADDLPYGLQRRLEIVRALATQPKVLLLDEPACGMNPNEAASVANLIRQIQQEQTLAILREFGNSTTFRPLSLAPPIGVIPA